MGAGSSNWLFQAGQRVVERGGVGHRAGSSAVVESGGLGRSGATSNGTGAGGNLRACRSVADSPQHPVRPFRRESAARRQAAAWAGMPARAEFRIAARIKS